MYEFTHVLSKLDKFIRKYYTLKLLKGVILFLAFGILLFLLILGVEYLLWLNTTARFVLFSVFILLELFLLFQYIVQPIIYLLKIKNGINVKYAAQIIGKHFPVVGDKLINLLELSENQKQSELLLASIAQKSKQLGPIPFSNAINYKDVLKYVKYGVIPVILMICIWLSGNWMSFFNTYERVINYEVAYEKPAPFQFELMTPNLDVLENESFTIQVGTKGKIKPQNVFITLEGKEILLQNVAGIYEYTFSPPIETTTFNFKANEVVSKPYTITALKTPSIIDFKMRLKYPSYLNKKEEWINSTGNATLPEGTKVFWLVESENTEQIKLKTKDTTQYFLKIQNQFELNKTIYDHLTYELTTSNTNIAEYEKLNYHFKIIKDAHPSIQVDEIKDSLNPNISYYSGLATDDYGLKEIKLVYYENTNKAGQKEISLVKPKSNFEQFYYTFPSGLNLAPGKNYSYYFMVIDNDAIHGGKTSKSQVYQSLLLDKDQLKNKDLESQQNLIRALDQSLERAKDQQKDLNEINQLQKEKNSLNFNDQSQIKDFLKKQDRQEELMQKFSKELKENLDKGNKDDKLNQLLQERLERQEKEAQKNQKLLEKLNEIADKINKEELSKKLEELGKKQQNSERSLEQLLELTKRYYVTEKTAQLARDLEKLSEKQEKLSKLNIGEDFSEVEQEELNEDFKEIEKELNELEKANQDLKKPIDIKLDKQTTEGVKDDQKDALDEIKKQNEPEQSSESKETHQNNASKKQQAAAQKMKEMSEQLGESSSGGEGGSSATEDAEMLRQILDNLIVFSFKQESLFDRLSEREEQDANQYSETVRDQKELRNLFEHVDDSLFALSLRQAELSEFVNEQITEVYYNIDKSLETMADGQMYQGISYQKYVLTAANSLADFLANVMDNMQESMQMGKGSGESEGGFQLPDIIKGQEKLGKQMGNQGDKGKEGQQGEEGQKGKNGENGENGKGGEKGQSGSKGERGENGKEGNGGQGSEGGKNGEGTNGRNGKENQGQGSLGEAELQEIYEIYQQQQQLRQELEKQLQNMINEGDRRLGEKLVKQMEDFENDLLENGITQRTRSKANTIQYELLKLENATLKQGKKSERESFQNTQSFENPIITKPSLLENYTNEIEILNRQSLPLRQNFQKKVKAYFKGND